MLAMEMDGSGEEEERLLSMNEKKEREGRERHPLRLWVGNASCYVLVQLYQYCRVWFGMCVSGRFCSGFSAEDERERERRARLRGR